MKKTLYVLACALCTLLVLPAAAQVPAYVPTDGLVGWWPFNGNANDESGNGNDGVSSNVEYMTSPNELAASFNGGNSLITIPNNIEFNTDTFSFSIRVKLNAHLGHNEIQFGVQGGALRWSIGWDPSIFYLFPMTCSGGYGSGQNYPSVPINTDTWYHMTFVNHGILTDYYLNGVYSGTSDMITPLSCWNSNMNLYLGGDIGGGATEYFNGLMDECGFWNRALTEQEIQNLYTGTTPPPCVSLPSNLQQGLVGYWPFCGNANDESGNGNDGAVNGATLTEDRFGNANAAFSFDGNDWIESSAIGMANGNNSATISGWFKRLSNSSGVEYIAGYGNPNIPSGSVFATGEYGSQGAFATFLGSSFDAISGIQLPIDSWHQLTSVHTQDGQVFIYLDGQLSYTAIVQTPDIQNMITRIGRAVWESEEYWNGSLDDIGIWNRALTPEEVQELYTLDACTFTVYDTLTVYETVYDTVYTYETIYDTVTTYVTVTDTLLIDITFTGIEGQPSWLNTVTVFPNPASDHITIDYGNFALMAGYNTIITDAAGATVYSSAVSSQQVEIDINAWGATGVYYMSVYDANGELVAVRHIVLE
jgi:hypothetical protein